MLIVQHVPGFIDVEHEPCRMIPTISAAWNLPWVKRWAEDPRFGRFEKSIGDDDHALLMAKMTDGTSWVVARVYCTAVEQIDMDLPVWHAPARQGDVAITAPPESRPMTWGEFKRIAEIAGVIDTDRVGCIDIYPSITDFEVNREVFEDGSATVEIL